MLRISDLGELSEYKNAGNAAALYAETKQQQQQQRTQALMLYDSRAQKAHAALGKTQNCVIIAIFTFTKACDVVWPAAADDATLMN